MATPHLETTLNLMLQEAKSLSRKEFLNKYNEPVLLAMGVLDTNQIRARCGSTLEVSVPKHATHNPKAKHPMAGKIFIIPKSTSPKGSLILGREAPADLVVPDDTVSVRHCRIAWDGQQVTLTDTDSTNGTRINLRALPKGEATQLFSEDIITVGRQSFQYYVARHFHLILLGLSGAGSVF